MASIADAERVQSALKAKFARTEGVRGIGVTWDEAGDAHVRINVEGARREAVESEVPAEYDGVPVEIRSVRAFRTF